jgi:hypothetical protein
LAGSVKVSSPLVLSTNLCSLLPSGCPHHGNFTLFSSALRSFPFALFLYSNSHSDNLLKRRCS